MNRQNSALLLVPLLIIAAIVGFIVFGQLRNNRLKNTTNEAQNTNASTEAEARIHQRRRDVVQILDAIETYAQNHSGTYPIASEVNAIVTNYLKTPLVERITQKPYVVQDSPPTALHEVQYATYATCTNASDGLKAASSPRAIALRVQMDDKEFYCASNSRTPLL